MALTLNLTAAEALAQVRRILNEPTALFWSDEEINNWIKEACIDISTKTSCFETKQDVALTTTSYVLLHDFTGDDLVVRIYSVLYLSDTDALNPTWKALQKITPEMVGRIPTDALASGAKDEAKYYYLWGEEGIYVYPVDAAGNYIRIFFSKATETITDLPATYRIAAVDYAVYCARLKERNNQKAMQALQKYQSVIMAQRRDTDKQEVNSKSDFQIPDQVVYMT